MNKIITFFIFVLVMLTLSCYAAPAYYYANTYEVTILNVEENEIASIEVLAPISDSKETSPEEEYEYISSELINYYGNSNIVNDIKCIKYKDVSKLNFKDNTCIIKIYNINDYQHEKNKTYFGGSVFLKIIKKDGEIVYTNTFCCYDLVDEFSSNEEYENAEKFPEQTGKFECKFDKTKTLLEVNLLDEIENKEEKSNYKIIILILFIILLFALIFISLKRRKNK